MGNLANIIKLLYPNATFGFKGNVKLQDDGQGIYIKEWGLEEPVPDLKELEAREAELTTALEEKKAVEEKEKLKEKSKPLKLAIINAWKEKYKEEDLVKLSAEMDIVFEDAPMLKEAVLFFIEKIREV